MPSANDPVIFTTKVPHGNEPSTREVTNPSARYRATAPANPPIPTNTQVMVRKDARRRAPPSVLFAVGAQAFGGNVPHEAPFGHDRARGHQEETDGATRCGGEGGQSVAGGGRHGDRHRRGRRLRSVWRGRTGGRRHCPGIAEAGEPADEGPQARDQAVQPACRSRALEGREGRRATAPSGRGRRRGWG